MTVRIAAPSIEHHRAAIGIGESRPRLSWIIESAPSGWTQAAYEISVERAGGAESVMVDSDRAGSGRLAGRPAALARASRRAGPGRRRRRRLVGVESGHDRRGGPARAGQTGRHDRSGRRGRRIASPTTDAPRSSAPTSTSATASSRRVCTRLRTVCTRPSSTGPAIGDDTLSPGWTVYPQRLRYYTYDVTDLVAPGANAIGAWLGDGWYRGRLGWRGGFRNLFGDDLSFLGQLELDLRRRPSRDGGDGCRVEGRALARSCAPASTTARTTTLASSSTDGRSPGFDDATWDAVAVRERDPRTLVAPTAPPVRCTEEVRPVDGADLALGRTHPRLRPEPRRPRAHPRRRVRRGRPCACAPPRCCRTARCTRGPLREARSTDSLHARRSCGRRGVGAAVHVPRLPLRRDRRLAGRPRRRGGRRRPRRPGVPHRPRAHRLVRDLRPPGEPPARERGLGHARQLRRHPDRLPAARRARGVDRRHPGLRAHRVLPLRRVGHAERLASRCRGRAAAGRHDSLVRPGDPRALRCGPRSARAQRGATSRR